MKTPFEIVNHINIFLVFFLLFRVFNFVNKSKAESDLLICLQNVFLFDKFKKKVIYLHSK